MRKSIDVTFTIGDASVKRTLKPVWNEEVVADLTAYTDMSHDETLLMISDMISREFTAEFIRSVLEETMARFHGGAK